MHMSKHCRPWNDRRKSKRYAEPHKLSKGHGTRSGRVDAMCRNHGMRQTSHGTRLDHFGGNFARKVDDVLADDVTDYARRWRYDDERAMHEIMLYDSTGMGRSEGPTYSLFDEILACPVKETRRKRRAKANFQQVAQGTSIDANDDLSDVASHIGTEITEGDIICAEGDSSDESESDVSLDYIVGDNECGDTDSEDEYDDCWDAYEDDNEEWVELFGTQSEDDELYYSDDDPFAVT